MYEQELDLWTSSRKDVQINELDLRNEWFVLWRTKDPWKVLHSLCPSLWSVFALALATFLVKEGVLCTIVYLEIYTLCIRS